MLSASTILGDKITLYHGLKYKMLSFILNSELNT